MGVLKVYLVAGIHIFYSKLSKHFWANCIALCAFHYLRKWLVFTTISHIRAREILHIFPWIMTISPLGYCILLYQVSMRSTAVDTKYPVRKASRIDIWLLYSTSGIHSPVAVNYSVEWFHFETANTYIPAYCNSEYINICSSTPVFGSRL